MIENREYGKAHQLTVQSIENTYKVKERWGTAWNLAILANVYIFGFAKPNVAAVMLGAVDALFEEIRASILPVFMEQHERSIEAARQALGDDAYDAAWNTGYAMDIDQAVAFALEDEGTVRNETHVD